MEKQDNKTVKVTKTKMACSSVLLLLGLKTQRSLDAAARLRSTIAIKGSLRSQLHVRYPRHKPLEFCTVGGCNLIKICNKTQIQMRECLILFTFELYINETYFYLILTEPKVVVTLKTHECQVVCLI